MRGNAGVLAVIQLVLLVHLRDCSGCHIGVFDVNRDSISNQTLQQFKLKSQCDIIWLESGNQPLQALASLTEAKAKFQLDAVIGTISRCTTVTELTTAWNILAFTVGCPHSELSALRHHASMYTSHIRMDSTEYSLLTYLPIIPDIVQFPHHPIDSEGISNGLAILVTATSKEYEAVWMDIMAKLKRSTMTIRAQWCFKNCSLSDSSEGQLLLVYGKTDQDFIDWPSRDVEYYNRYSNLWVVMVSEQSINLTQVQKWIPYHKFREDRLMLLHHDRSLMVKNEMVTNALEVFDRTRQLKMLEGSPFSDPIRRRCIDVNRDNTLCFDDVRWYVPDLTLLNISRSDVKCRELGKLQISQTAIPMYQPSQCKQSDQDKLILSGSNDGNSKFEERVVTVALVALCATLALVLIVGVVMIIYFKLKCGENEDSSGQDDWAIQSEQLTYSDNAMYRSDTQQVDPEEQRILTSDVDNNKQLTYRGEIVELNAIQNTTEGTDTVLTALSNDSNLKQQLKAMAKLNDEHLVKFYGITTYYTDQIVTVTGFCEGTTLKDLLTSQTQQLNDGHLTSILNGIIHGLWGLHDSAVGYHGNLTSSKCIVQSNWKAKLADFGLVELRQVSKEDTPWLSMEKLAGKDKGSADSDVYAFGIILYELIGRQGPFGCGYLYTADELEELANDIVHNGRKPDMSVLCCEDLLKNIMTKCWKPSEKRPTIYKLMHRLSPLNSSSL